MCSTKSELALGSVSDSKVTVRRKSVTYAASTSRIRTTVRANMLPLSKPETPVVGNRH